MSKAMPLVELPLDWDDENVNHIGRHSVTRDEVEQVVRNGYTIDPARTGSGELITDRYILRGSTDSGKHLLIVIWYPVTRQRDWGEMVLELARPITARHERRN